MSAQTSIEWTTRTWNPVTGCTKVSPGCKHCYAETIAQRFWSKQYPGRKGFTEVRCHPDRLDEPLRWRKPARIFVNSMSDLFHEYVSDDFIGRIFAVMALAPRHTFQVLTKRPERMRAYLSGENQRGIVLGRAWEMLGHLPKYAHAGILDRPWPLPNVHLGVSVENQEAAHERIPLLLQTPAAVRFLSVEPLLGPVDLMSRYLRLEPRLAKRLPGIPDDNPGVDWVIVGGESGRGARPCDVAWIRFIVEQCKATGVPCFVKQLGAKPHVQDPLDLSEWTPSSRWYVCTCGKWLGTLSDRKGGAVEEWPSDLRVREFPEVRP